MLKYGLNPNKNSNLRSKFDVPSYKKDAMKLIANRIYKHIGSVFEELKRRAQTQKPTKG